ncbi:hypothetical protein LguiB_023771 [Lonicera macranthoides]
MDWGLRFRVSYVLMLALIIVSWELILSDMNGDDYNYGTDLCSVDVGAFLPLPYSDLPNSICKPIWNSFRLRYSNTNEKVITIILSTLYTSGWVGIGLSKNGKMINASALVGWINEEGLPTISQYHLEGFTPSKIIPIKGDLPLTKEPPFVAVHGATIYLAFQLKFTSPLKDQPILLAFGTKYPNYHRLTPHDDKKTLRFDFSSGNIQSESTKPKGLGMGIQTHGILGLIGWGVILPYGAIIARYLKQKGPLWFYLHLSIQLVGFLVVIGTVVIGFELKERLHADIPVHKALGIFTLALSILQVSALILRPKEESKKRRYWNWFHSWMGRIALFWGAVNIVLGIQVGGAGIEWKIGYGIVLGTLLLSCTVLEALLLLNSSDMSPPPPPIQTNSI